MQTLWDSQHSFICSNYSLLPCRYTATNEYKRGNIDGMLPKERLSNVHSYTQDTHTTGADTGGGTHTRAPRRHIVVAFPTTQLRTCGWRDGLRQCMMRLNARNDLRRTARYNTAKHGTARTVNTKRNGTVRHGLLRQARCGERPLHAPHGTDLALTVAWRPLSERP